MLPDGRRFDYLILGDPAGRPCVFGPQDYGLTRADRSLFVKVGYAWVR